MKKRVLALLVSAVMVAASLAGCGAAKEQAAEKTEEAVEKTEEKVEEVKEQAEETAEKTEEPAKEEAASSDSAPYAALKIGMIFNVSKDDGGWCQAQWTGLCDAASRMGLSEDQYIGIEQVAEEPVAASSAIEELLGQGCNVIIGASTGYAPILEDMAPQHPNVQFVQVGVPLKNVLTYHGRGYQGMYALGYMMAKLDGTDNMGYVAGMSEASVRFSINGFALGAKAANPNVKINLQWANSWWDQTAEAECANVLMAAGVKYMGTGTTSPGAAQACAEKGAFCTGYDVDHSDFAPNAVTASLVWDWSPIFEEIFKTFAQSGYKPYVDNYFWGVEHNCVKIAFNDKILDADLIAETQGILDKIAAGEIDVFGGELKDNEGNVLVAAGATMEDSVILDQEFLVDNVVGKWS